MLNTLGSWQTTADCKALGIHFSVCDHSFLALWDGESDSLELIENWAGTSNAYSFDEDIEDIRTIGITDFAQLLKNWRTGIDDSDNDEFSVEAITSFVEGGIIDREEFTAMGCELFEIDTDHLAERTVNAIQSIRLMREAIAPTQNA